MALSIGGALMLGACSPAEPAPPPTLSTVAPSEATTPTPTSSPSPTHEPTESQPPELPGYPESLLVEPEAMSKDDEAGAVAAAKYYVSLFEYVHATGDLARWEAMALPGCGLCDSVAEGVRELYGSGGREEAGRIELVGKPSTDFIDTVNVWEVTVRIRVGPSTVFDADGNVVKEFGEARNKITVGVVRMGGAWRVQGMRASDDT